MKATKILALVATVWLMANCSQEDVVNRTQPQNPEPSQQGITSLKAAIEGSSRSAVDDGGVFSWTEGDVIGVFDGTSFVEFTYNVNTEEFEGYAQQLSGYAIYPYNANHKNENGTVKVNMPAEYAHGSTNAIMLAEVKEQNPTNLTFKHLGGVMRFIVKDVPAGANEFVFTAKDKGITGEFTVTDSNDGKVITANGTVNNNNAVTITFTKLATPQDMVFYVPVPVGEYPGYSVAISGDDNLSLADGNASQSASNTVKRRSLLLMPEFTCTNGGITKGSNNTVTLEAQEQTLNISGDKEEVLVEVPIVPAEDGTKAVLNVNFIPTAASSSDSGNETTTTLTISDGNEGPSTTSEAEVVVNIPSQDTEVVPDLKIEAPTLTVTLASGTYGTVTAKTATETLIIKSGVNITELNVEGGKVEIEEGAVITTNNYEEPTENTISDLAGLKTAFQTGGIYKLGAAIEVTEALTVSEDLSLDFNGQTLTMGANTINVASGKTLTWSNNSNTNGGVTGSGDIITAAENAKIYIGKNVNLTSSENCCIFIPRGANGVTVETAGNLVSTGGNYAPLYVNGDVTSGNIRVKGGTITHESNTAVYAAGQVNLTIEGNARIAGVTGVEIRAGRLDVKGGEINATGDPFTSSSNGNGSTSVGAAIAVCQHTTNHPLYANIYGGTFTGVRALYEEDLEDTNVGNIGLNVKGGNFAGEIFSENCKEFIHGGTFTAAASFSYLAEKASIALGAGMILSETITIAAGKTLNLDLNGNDLSYTVSNDGKASAIFNNYGTLNITNTGSNKDAKLSFVAEDPDLQAIPSYATNTISNDGTLTIGENVTVTNESDGGASYAVDDRGVFTLNGGKLIGKRCALRVAKFNQDNVKFTMNDGLVQASTPAWIHLPGSDSNVAPTITVEINDGTIQTTKESSFDNDVLYTYSYGNSHKNTKVTINGGSFLGGVVSIGSGYKGDVPTLTINGGTFEYDVVQWLENDESKVLFSANK